MVKNCAFSHKIDYIFIFKELLYLEEHRNCIAGSRVMAILLNGWIFPFGQSGEAGWWGVCYQRGLPCLVLPSQQATQDDWNQVAVLQVWGNPEVSPSLAISREVFLEGQEEVSSWVGNQVRNNSSHLPPWIWWGLPSVCTALLYHSYSITLSLLYHYYIIEMSGEHGRGVFPSSHRCSGRGNIPFLPLPMPLTFHYTQLKLSNISKTSTIKKEIHDHKEENKCLC